MEISFFPLAQAQLKPNWYLPPLARFSFFYFPHDLCSAHPNFLSEVTDNAKFGIMSVMVSFCNLGQENKLHKKPNEDNSKKRFELQEQPVTRICREEGGFLLGRLNWHEASQYFWPYLKYPKKLRSPWEKELSCKFAARTVQPQQADSKVAGW